MKKIILPLFIIIGFSTTVLAQKSNSVKKAGKDVGKTGAKVGKDVGKTGAKVGKDVGKAGVKIGKSIAKPFKKSKKKK